MARTILVAVKDLLFGSKIEAAARSSQTLVSWSPRFERVSDVARTRAPDTVIADLREPGMLDELAAIKQHAPATRIVGYVRHTQDDVIARAKEIGLDEVLTMGQFAASVERILLRERGDAP